MLSSKVKVPMPEKGITIRGSGSRRYVYKVTRAYRNKKGQPTSDRKQVGRLDEATGMLIPNDNYWELCVNGPIEILPAFDSIRSVGATFIIESVLERLGITRMLVSALGEGRAEQTTKIATYMACRGNIMEGLLDWCESYTLSKPVLSSQLASTLFGSITHDERMTFFRAWATERAAGQAIAYDVTSFSTYAKGITDAEWGYNRDGDRLPQVNLGCYLSQQSGLPIFYVTYPGSIVDKSHLPYMMEYNDELGIKDAIFVMDKGFCATVNVRHMHASRLPYIMGVDGSHKATRVAIDSVRDDIVTMSRRIGEGVYANTIRSIFYGELANLHVFCDPTLAERQRADMQRVIEVKEEKLHQLKQLTKREAKRYSDLFDINLAGNGSFTFSRNYAKIDAMARDAGFFCLLTNTDFGSREALEIYRRKDMVEKGFDDLKNHIDMKRLRTHSKHTTEGKLFVAFVSLIAISHISNKLSSFMRERSMSKDALIAEVEKIRVVFTIGGSRLMNPITKTQRTIIEGLGFTEEDLKSYISCSQCQ